MKLASEVYISSYSHLNNLQAIIFRFPNVVGKNLTHGLLYDMKKKLILRRNFYKFLEMVNNKSHILM